MNKINTKQIENDLLTIINLKADESEIVIAIVKKSLKGLLKIREDDFEIEKVLSEEQEEDLQDEVEFLEEISPNLNQLVSEFNLISFFMCIVLFCLFYCLLTMYL